MDEDEDDHFIARDNDIEDTEIVREYSKIKRKSKKPAALPNLPASSTQRTESPKSQDLPPAQTQQTETPKSQDLPPAQTRSSRSKSQDLPPAQTQQTDTPKSQDLPPAQTRSSRSRVRVLLRSFLFLQRRLWIFVQLL